MTTQSDSPLPLSGGGYVQHPSGRLERVQAPTAPAGPKSRPPPAASRPRPNRPAPPSAPPPESTSESPSKSPVESLSKE